MKLITDRHELSRGLFATAELLVCACFHLVIRHVVITGRLVVVSYDVSDVCLGAESLSLTVICCASHFV